MKATPHAVRPATEGDESGFDAHRSGHGSIGPETEGHLLAADTKPVAGSRSIRKLPASRWLVWPLARDVVAVP